MQHHWPCAKWINHNDEAIGLIGKSISEYLKFYIQSLNTPQEAWLKFEQLFGKMNLIHAHQLENQLMALDATKFLKLKTTS
jgi:hypothetical protein